MIAAVHDFLIIMSVMIEGLLIEVLFHAGRAAVVDTIRRARVAIIKLAAGSPFVDISIEPRSCYIYGAPVHSSMSLTWW